MNSRPWLRPAVLLPLIGVLGAAAITASAQVAHDMTSDPPSVECTKAYLDLSQLLKDRPNVRPNIDVHTQLEIQCHTIDYLKQIEPSSLATLGPVPSHGPRL